MSGTLTDKWILAQKHRTPKIQFAKHKKIKRRKDQWVILHSSLEQGTKYPRKELQRQSLELRWKDGPSRDYHTWDLSHNQPPNPDTIAYASKILLKGTWYSYLMWNYASAWQIQKWMLTVIYWMEHRAPNGEARESTQGAEGVCNPIGGTTIWTSQYPQSSCL